MSDPPSANLSNTASPRVRQNLVAVVGAAEDDRRHLAALFAHDPGVRVVASCGLDDPECVAVNGEPHLIVGTAETHDECERFRRIAARWASAVSILFVNDPADLGRLEDDGLGAINEVRERAQLEPAEAMPELLASIRTRFHPESIDRAEARQRDEAALARLSERERTVLALTAEGSSMKQIAARLHRSYATVASHRDSIRRKLGMHDVATLTRFAIRTRLVQP